MIDVNKVLGRLPHYKAFQPVSRLNKFVEGLRRDRRFTIAAPGHSELGEPIYHVRFGTGKLKVLIVGYPHPNEPDGGLTVLALLTLLKEGCPELAGQGIEWHIVPCATPDGAALAEGWTLKPFSFERFMEYYFRKDPCHDLESSFPVKYGKMDFKKPVSETRALMKVLRAARPALYYSLHNATHGGAFFLVGRDLGAKYYSRFYRLMRGLGMPLHTEKLDLALKTYGKSVYSEILIKDEYDSLRKSMSDPTRYIKSGATPVEYLRKYNKDAFSFICEFPHVTHRPPSRGEGSGQNRRRQVLRGAADEFYLLSVIFSEWRRVKGDINKKSPFYTQVAARMPGREEYLREARFSGDTLKDDSLDRAALKSEEFDDCLGLYYNLCWNWQFVRLLEDSRQTPGVKAARARIEKLLREFYAGLETKREFSSFRSIPIASLVKAQLGSGLIVINSMLERSRG